MFLKTRLHITGTVHTRRLVNSYWHFGDHSAFICRVSKGKGKAVPLQACSGPEGSRKLRFPDFMTTAQDGGKVSLTPYAPAAFTPRNTPGTHFC
jgi:hypothetical protein